MNAHTWIRPSAVAFAAVLVLLTPAAFAQTASDDNHGAHHPAATSQPPDSPKSSEMPKGMMGQDGGGMMGMMGRGGMMGMCHPALMGMMGIGDHVEGRIAFLKAELKITDAQMSAWNAFADVLRAKGQRMAEMRNSIMQGGMMGQGGAGISAEDLLDRMERMMTTALDAVKATKTALTPLYAVLTDEQKKTADGLLIAGHMGIM
jgi:hypothetical protein